ncbi:MAG: 2-oxo acid dehydrogenase subunit E2 [Clostridia bacterium]|nr:2-oxo acid dehydrogenase subunit E2 [Clostridia bacterium]
MRKRRFGDRYDGYRIRKGDPTNVIIPFLMKERSDSLVYFDCELDLSKVEELIRTKRKEGMDIGVLDYAMTALVRCMSQYPRANRFVAGRRLYARNELLISMAVKKKIDNETPETIVKFKFNPEDTVNDVCKKIRATIAENKGVETSNSLDGLLKVVNHLPRFVYSAAVNFVTWLDFHGKMPKAINRVSPFHTSIFLTNMGSIGEEAIYHHIYNWGTTSVFFAMGRKKKINVLNSDGTITEKKIMKTRFTADERIADGLYLASFLKYMRHLFLNPELLESAPEKIIEDDQV